MTTFSCLWCSAIPCEKGNYHATHAKGDKKLKWNLFGRVAFLQKKTLRRVAAHTTISYKVKIKKKVPTFWNTYSAGETNYYKKCESCCVSPVQHFPLTQILISTYLSKIVRPVAKELLKKNSPLANLVMPWLSPWWLLPVSHQKFSKIIHTPTSMQCMLYN